MINILCNTCKNYDYCFDRDDPHNTGCDNYKNENALDDPEASEFLIDMTFDELKKAAKTFFYYLPNLMVYQVGANLYASRINSAVIILHANDVQDAKAKISKYLAEGGSI